MGDRFLLLNPWKRCWTSAPFQKKEPKKGARSFIWYRSIRKSTLFREYFLEGKSRHFALLRGLGTLLGLIDLWDAVESSTGVSSPAVGAAGRVNSWNHSWRFPRPPPPAPEEGRKETLKKTPSNRCYFLCCFSWFHTCLGLQACFLPKLFLRILTLFALGVLPPHRFEGTNIFHGLCEVDELWGACWWLRGGRHSSKVLAK